MEFNNVMMIKVILSTSAYIIHVFTKSPVLTDLLNLDPKMGDWYCFFPETLPKEALQICLRVESIGVGG